MMFRTCLLIALITALTFGSVHPPVLNQLKAIRTSPSQLSVPGNPNELYRTLPLVFEPNKGEADARFDFLARGAGYSLLFSAAETVFVIGQAKSVRSTRHVNDNQS